MTSALAEVKNHFTQQSAFLCYDATMFVTAATVRNETDLQRYCDRADKFDRWQHPAMARRRMASFTVPGKWYHLLNSRRKAGIYVMTLSIVRLYVA